MKLACFLSLVACVAGFGSFDGAEDAPTVSTEETVVLGPDGEETCESLIARDADLTCSACCPNECAEFDYTNADAYKTDTNEEGDDFFNFATYAYDFRGHDGCVCFNDMFLNSDYGSVHLTEGNDCALVISNADIHGLGGDEVGVVLVVVLLELAVVGLLLGRVGRGLVGRRRRRAAGLAGRDLRVVLREVGVHEFDL